MLILMLTKILEISWIATEITDNAASIPSDISSIQHLISD